MLWSGGGYAAEYTVSQKGKQFSEESMTINVGDMIYFKNDDPFYHNVFSASKVSTFDLGSYKKGKSRTVVFDKVGMVEVECAIHPQMYLEIKVIKPWLNLYVGSVAGIFKINVEPWSGMLAR